MLHNCNYFAGFCSNTYFYVVARTSDRARSPNTASIVITLNNRRTAVVKLYNHRRKYYSPKTGTVWKIPASAIKFKRCVKIWNKYICHTLPTCPRKKDIKRLSLVIGRRDSWSIIYVVTYLRINKKYEILSKNFNAFRWLATSSYRYVPLKLVNK